MKRRWTLHPFFIAIVFLIASSLAGPAVALETKAQQAILMDAKTGAVLLSKNADTPVPPSSMSKIMTIYVLFDAIKSGRVSLDDSFPVSEKAWRKGGSKMFVDVNTRVKVSDLLRGIIVQSGNDASIVVAEGLAGSEGAFAEQMNEMAERLGLRDSHFQNASGWPEPPNRMSVRDLAILAMRTMEDFPDLYSIYGETEFTYHDIKQANRNPLLYKAMGADGLKTGHTEEAGYGLTASAARGDRRLVLVVNGLESVQERSAESERLIEWGFREFDNYALFAPGETVAEVETWLGDPAKLSVMVPNGLTVTLPRSIRDKISAKVTFDGPLPAPIAAGQRVNATLVVEAEGIEPLNVPLYAGEKVEKLGLVGRVFSALWHLTLGRAPL